MKYAEFNHTADQPTPVTGWYDADAIDYPELPAEADRIEVSEVDWPDRFDTPYVRDGQLVPAPEPSTADKLAAAQAAQISELQAGFAATIAGGATSGALGTPHIYPVDRDAQSDLQACVIAALIHQNDDDWTTEFACAPAAGGIDMDDWDDAEHSADQIIQVGEDVMAWYSAQRKQLKMLSKQVKAVSADDHKPVETVQAIEWSEIRP